MAQPFSTRRVTPQYLEDVALHYLERFTSSVDNLRHVLMSKVELSVVEHGIDRNEAAQWVETLIEKYRANGMLNDETYAWMRAESLHRRGVSVQAIRERLAGKGVNQDDVAGALKRMGDDTMHDLDLKAAVALAKRRRLGPFRPEDLRAAFRTRDLAALGRAGFSYDTARMVVDALDADSLFEDQEQDAISR